MIFVFIFFAALSSTSGLDFGLAKHGWIQTLIFGKEERVLQLNFSDGTSDSVLFREKMKTAEFECIWKGNLQKKPDVFVTASGPCPLQDTFQLTIVANSALPGQIMKVDNGVMKQDDSLSTDSIATIEDFPTFPDFPSQSRATKAFPAEGLKIQVALFSDDSFRAMLKEKSETTMLTVLGMAQPWFFHPSLTTKVFFEVLGWYEYKGTLVADDDSMSRVLANQKKPKAFVNLYFAYEGIDRGKVGISSLGTYCRAKHTAAIVEYRTDDSTATTVAHEIGHILGMAHDFIGTNPRETRLDKNGNSCLRLNNIMHYGENRDQWSTCSVEDFLATYNEKLCFKANDCVDSKFCNQEIETDPSLCLVPANALFCPKSCNKC